MNILSAISNNPIAKVGNGYQQATWINVTQTQTGTVQGFKVQVFANTPQERATNTLLIKQYLERVFPKHQISVGIGANGTLNILWSKFLHKGSFAPIKKPKPPTGKLHSFSNAFGQGFNK